MKHVKKFDKINEEYNTPVYPGTEYRGRIDSNPENGLKK